MLNVEYRMWNVEVVSAQLFYIPHSVRLFCIPRSTSDIQPEREMAKREAKRTYEGRFQEKGAKKIAAPNIPYRPRNPKKYRPAIGLIGCGGITEKHLAAY